MKKLFALLLLFLFTISLNAQITGQFTGNFYNVPAGIPTTGLVNCWFFHGTPSTVPDFCGIQPFVPYSGTPQGYAWSGLNYSTDTVFASSAGYYATPQTQYNAVTGTASSYKAPANASQTLGDGNPHTLIYVYEIPLYTYNSGGAQGAGGTPISKTNEYEIVQAQAGGGSITLKYGTGYGSSLVALAYPALANRFSGYTGSTTNLGWGRYMVRITYDGTSNLCIGINDAAATCATGVTLTTGGAQLLVNAPVNMEMMLSYNSVLLSSHDSGATCGVPFSTTPCIIDTIYNTALYNRYPWKQQANTSNIVDYQVNGGSCVGDQGWGSTYTTYQSGTQLTPTWVLHNPMSTCTVTVSGTPALTFNIVGTNGASALNAYEGNIAVQVDGGTYQILQIQQTGGQKITLALSSTGSHTVKFNAVSYVGFGSNTTPFVGAVSTLVNDISCYGLCSAPTWFECVICNWAYNSYSDNSTSL